MIENNDGSSITVAKFNVNQIQNIMKLYFKSYKISCQSVEITDQK